MLAIFAFSTVELEGLERGNLSFVSSSSPDAHPEPSLDFGFVDADRFRLQPRSRHADPSPNPSQRGNAFETIEHRKFRVAPVLCGRQEVRGDLERTRTRGRRGRRRGGDSTRHRCKSPRRSYVVDENGKEQKPLREEPGSVAARAPLSQESLDFVIRSSRGSSKARELGSRECCDGAFPITLSCIRLLLRRQRLFRREARFQIMRSSDPSLSRTTS